MRSSLLAVLLGIVVLLTAGCAEQAGSSPRNGVTGGGGGPAASSTQSSGEGADATEAPTAPPTVSFKAIALKGRGDKVAKFSIPDGAGAIVTLTHSGSANFIVETVGSDGATGELLVNEVGTYSGTRLFDAESNEHSVAFKIQADGAWTATIKPVSAARAWNGRSKLSGKGDDVVLIDPPTSGLTTAVFTHRGSANFIVEAYGADGRDVLINEIGNYSGEVMLSNGSFVLAISADGAWTAVVSS